MEAKERARAALSTPGAAGALRRLTGWQRLPWSIRHRLFIGVARQLRPPSSIVFEQRIPTGGTIRLHVGGVTRELYWVGEYEPESLPLFTEYARNARCVLDIGASEGIYSLYAAAAGARKVLAFEPGSEQRRLMDQNLALNPALAASVEVLDVALDDHTGTAEFFVSGGTSSLNPDFRRPTATLTVEVDRGDDRVARHAGGLPVDLVKVDTESTEPAVLRGLQETIRRDRPAIFCEVLAGRTEEPLQELIGDLGYEPWHLTLRGQERRPRLHGDNSEPNWLLLPRGATPPVGHR